MKKIKKSSQEEMLLEFLKAEETSNRFSEKLLAVLEKMNVDESIITNGDISNEKENKIRLNIMKKFRQYPTGDIFVNFPKMIRWDYVEFEEGDIEKIYYVNYPYWNELSSNTSKVLVGSENVLKGIHLSDGNTNTEDMAKGVEYLKNHSFPPVVLITCNDEKYVTIEGHSRMTVYGMGPDKFVGTHGYIGYCSEEDMMKYNSKMV